MAARMTMKMIARTTVFTVLSPILDDRAHLTAFVTKRQ
jgi:hypothetical protein